MKATGIVRRIDDLGRVVIPKEIRRTMRIREGDPLEIYTDRDGGVIFKKYSLMGGLDDFAAQLCETMSRSTGAICAVTDRDSVIAVAGGAKRELLGKPGFVHPDRLPVPGDALNDGSVGYHLRLGKHYLSREDWNRYMDFLDQKGWGAQGR